MNNFLVNKLKLFLLVSIGLIGTFFINEIYISKLTNLSKKQKIFFNPRFKQSIIDFKLNQEKKEISIIGTSRTAGFEQEMFLNKSVYNYSMITWSLEDVFSLIKKIKFDKNDTILLGIDQWNFNKSYLNRLTNSFKINNLNLPFIFFDKVYQIKNISLIGSKALYNYSGFRNDGSYFDGKRLALSDKELIASGISLPPSRNPDDINFNKYYKRIMGSEIDQNQLKILKKILRYCKKKKIILFGFFPPFAPSVFKKMKSDKYNYTFIEKSKIEIEHLFSEYNYQFKDFTEYDYFDDSFFLDGSHCNRNVYYQIIKDLKIPANPYFDNFFNASKFEIELVNKNFKTKR